MKSIELLSTGIRLLGVFIFLSAIKTGISVYQSAIQVGTTIEVDMVALKYVGLFEFALMSAIACLMLKFPVTIAKKLLPKTDGNEVAFDGSTRDIEISLFVIIGVYILSWAVPDLFYNGIWWWYSTQSEITGLWEQSVKGEYPINLIVTLIEIAIGVFLCLGAQGISKLLRNLREANAK